MTREADMALLEFCASQQLNFEPGAWFCLSGISDRLLASAALFLSMSAQAWYGHSDELASVAERLSPSASFTDLVNETRFDYVRFSPMLKMRLRYACPLS